MPADSPTILATSGGLRLGTRSRFRFNSLVHHAVDLSGVTGRAPRITHVGTALGDQRSFNAEVDEAARLDGFDLSHLNLFPMPSVDDIEGYLLGQDVVWVNGGSVVNLLAVWRAHGLDQILPRVWRAGVDPRRRQCRLHLLVQGRHDRLVPPRARSGDQRASTLAL